MNNQLRFHQLKSSNYAAAPINTLQRVMQGQLPSVAELGSFRQPTWHLDDWEGTQGNEMSCPVPRPTKQNLSNLLRIKTWKNYNTYTSNWSKLNLPNTSSKVYHKVLSCPLLGRFVQTMNKRITSLVSWDFWLKMKILLFVCKEYHTSANDFLINVRRMGKIMRFYL